MSAPPPNSPIPEPAAPALPGGPAPLLELRDITKRFAGTLALRDARLRVRPGEVHALAGQNGAGKSTLIRIVGGSLARDGGAMTFDGREARFDSPQAALRAGIATIHQELNLIPYATIAENLFLGRFPRRGGLIDWRRVRAEARALMERLGLEVDVDRPLAACSASLRQMTAIARAVSEGARLIIMDEPTSSLDEAEVERLLDTVRGLRASGVATLFVTHRLDEFYAVCEGITVLRDGATVHEGPLADLPRSELVHRMVGRAVPGAGAGRAARAAPTGAPWLAARGLSDGQRVRAVSLDLRPGEVLGLAGLLGSGRSETARMIFADIRPDGGEVRVEGAARAPASPRAAIALGFGFCGEDRKTDGIVPLLSVRDNLTLALLPRLARLGIVGRRRQRAVVAEFIERLGIRTASMDQPIRELSGGNQQKVLLARWMAMAPRLLILDEPTRGIDVGAKAEIQRIAGEMAARGASILLVSSEIEELIAQADRVVVLRDGRDVALVEGEAITEGALVHAMAQGHAAEAAA